MDILNLAGKDIILVTLAHSEKPVGRVKKFTPVTTMETTLHKWEAIEVKYSNFLLLGLLGSSEI